MKVISIHKKPEPNIEIIAALQMLVEQATNGNLQAMAFAIQCTDGTALHDYVSAPDEVPMDERLLLAELQICVADVSLGFAHKDENSFSSTLLTYDEIEE